MRKTFLLQSLLALTSLSAFAANNSNMHSDHMMKSSDGKMMNSYEMAQSKMITPEASPVVKDDVDFYLSADFIYWTAVQDNLVFAETDFEPLSGTIIDNQVWNTGRTYRVNNSYSPGFKVGGGMVFDYDGWDLDFQFTWYRTTNTCGNLTGSVDRINGTGLFNPFLFQSVFPNLPVNFADRSVSASWRLSYNEFDLGFGRDFFISKKLTLRPHFGIRAGWISQRFISTWNLTNTSQTGSQWLTRSNTMTNRSKFWNAGFRSGLDTSWMFTRNWSMYGDVAFSTLWSRFSSSRIDVATTEGSTDPNSNVSNFQTVNRENVNYKLVPVLEMGMGIRSDWYFGDNDDYRLRLQAGWEQQVWIGTNEFYSIAALSNFSSGNLSLQGFTLEARFDF